MKFLGDAAIPIWLFGMLVYLQPSLVESIVLSVSLGIAQAINDICKN